MNRLTLMLAALMALSVAACRPQNEIELTLVAQNVDLQTQIAAVYETATVDADQLQITLEYMNTQVAQSQEQNNDLRATLVARGTESGAITNPDPQSFTPSADNPDPQPTASAAEGTPMPGQTSGGQSAATPTAAEESAQPSLTNIVMSTDVGPDDCAQGVTTTFSTSTEQIYVVATANNITPGTTLVSRWFREGESVVTYDFTPDFAIDGNCIWFFIDQADTEFIPGTWSVQLEVDGAEAGAPATFTIIE